MVSGILGLLLLFADILAIVDIANKDPVPAVKAIWTGIILLLPLIGSLLWFWAGPRRAKD